MSFAIVLYLIKWLFLVLPVHKEDAIHNHNWRHVSKNGDQGFGTAVQPIVKNCAS